jgi:hypothetical protein
LFLGAIISWELKSFRAPFAFSDLLGAVAFFVALAAGFFAADFFAGFDDFACAFVAFGRDAFFAGALAFAGFLEFFFLAELAIMWESPLVSRARAEAY